MSNIFDDVASRLRRILERFGHCPGGEISSSKFDLSYSLHSKEELIHSFFGLAFH